MCDFGAESSYVKATKHVKEHYGIEVPPSSERNVTLFHARAMESEQKKKLRIKIKDQVNELYLSVVEVGS